MATSGPAARGGFNGPAGRGGFNGPAGRGMAMPGPTSRGMAASTPGQTMGGPPGGQMMGAPPGGVLMGGQPGGPMMTNGAGGMMRGPMTGGPPIGGMVQTSGPPCDVCQEPIVGRLVNAVGKTYHPDHFVCEYCSQPFPGGKFLVGPDQKLYCETDFMELHAKICAVCNDVVKGKVVTTPGGKSYHSEHFICVSCGTSLVGKQYKVHKETELIYCPRCLEKEVATVRPEAHPCAMCGEPIVGAYLKIKGQFLHPRHFRCEECGCEFKGGDCREFEGDFYCIPHYEILLLKKCAKCGKPCKGRSITALGKTWHLDHFTCHICNEPFVGSNFYENDGLPYCQTHYVQNFGDNCADCNQPIIVGGMKFLGKAYHDEHFRCSSCTKILKIGEFTAWDAKPLCKTCYKKLPKAVRKRVEHRLKAEKAAKKTRQKGEAAIFDGDGQ